MSSRALLGQLYVMAATHENDQKSREDECDGVGSVACIVLVKTSLSMLAGVNLFFFLKGSSLALWLV